MGRLPQWHEYATEGRLEPIRTRLVGILPTGRGEKALARAGEMDPPAYPEMLLVEMARPQGAGTEPATVGTYRQSSRCGDEWSRRVESGRPAGITPGAEQRRPETARLSLSLNACREVRRLGSTAGCGKPHVRWCGRVAGRNPRHSTRSRAPAPHRSTERGLPESSRYPTITPFGAGGKPLSDRTVLSVLPAVLIGNLSSGLAMHWLALPAALRRQPAGLRRPAAIDPCVPVARRGFSPPRVNRALAGVAVALQCGILCPQTAEGCLSRPSFRPCSPSPGLRPPTASRPLPAPWPARSPIPAAQPYPTSPSR